MKIINMLLCKADSDMNALKWDTYNREEWAVSDCDQSGTVRQQWWMESGRLRGMKVTLDDCVCVCVCGCVWVCLINRQGSWE